MSDEGRPVQYFSDEYLAHCRTVTPDRVCEFLEDYRHIVAASRVVPRKAISIRVQVPLLRAFREKAESRGVAYQTQIHRLMKEWVLGG